MDGPCFNCKPKISYHKSYRLIMILPHICWTKMKREFSIIYSLYVIQIFYIFLYYIKYEKGLVVLNFISFKPWLFIYKNTTFYIKVFVFSPFYHLFYLFWLFYHKKLNHTNTQHMYVQNPSINDFLINYINDFITLIWRKYYLLH